MRKALEGRRRKRIASAIAPLAATGGQDWSRDEAHGRCIRGRSRWLLARALAASTRNRASCYPTDECCRVESTAARRL